MLLFQRWTLISMKGILIGLKGGRKEGKIGTPNRWIFVSRAGFLCCCCPHGWLHYPGRVVPPHFLTAQLSSSLIGFGYIKPPWPRGQSCQRNVPFFTASLKAGGVQAALRMVIGYLFRLLQVGLCWVGWKKGADGDATAGWCLLFFVGHKHNWSWEDCRNSVPGHTLCFIRRPLAFTDALSVLSVEINSPDKGVGTLTSSWIGSLQVGIMFYSKTVSAPCLIYLHAMPFLLCIFFFLGVPGNGPGG